MYNFDNKIPVLSINDIKKFKLYYDTGTDIKVYKPIWEGYDCVWATAVPFSAYYKVYDCGTNCLRVLKYFNNSWEEVGIKGVDNLYGLVWQMANTIHYYINKE